MGVMDAFVQSDSRFSPHKHIAGISYGFIWQLKNTSQCGSNHQPLWKMANIGFYIITFIDPQQWNSVVVAAQEQNEVHINRVQE